MDKLAENAIDRNIAAMHRVRADGCRNMRHDLRLIDFIARFVGAPLALYAHILLYGVWLSYCVYHGAPWADRLNVLSVAVGLEAIFLTMFVLINQRRMASAEQKNEDLHMQMSLLAEHEITRIAQVVDMIAQRLFIDTKTVGDLSEVKKEVDPEEVLAKISEVEKSNERKD